MRTPFRWAGNKAGLAADVRRIVPDCGRWVEPFAGGAGLAVALGVRSAHLNDVNPLLIQAWKAIQTGHVTHMSPLPDRDAFTSLRERLRAWTANGRADTIDATRAFMTLQAHAFRGFQPTDVHGAYRSSYGGWPHDVQVVDLAPVRAVVREWTFSTGDFASIELVDGDVLFVDPPYVASRGQNERLPFERRDFERLLDWLDRFDGPVIVTQRVDPWADGLLGRYGFVRWSDARWSSKRDGREAGWLRNVASM